MNSILKAGKYMYAIPFAIFGIFHFAAADSMAQMAFGSPILVYITGAALIAASVSILIGKMDKLGATLLGVFLILMALIVHREAAMSGDMTNFLKDLALAGAAWMYALNLSKDKAVIG